MNVQPYLFFNGQCEAALDFYGRALGAEIVQLLRFKDSPEPHPPGMLPPGAEGQITSGIGQTIARGSITLIPPTVSIDHTGQELTLDGVKIRFQYTPSTEAPAEMNLYFPDLRILDMAENANVSMHNILTPRGALKHVCSNKNMVSKSFIRSSAKALHWLTSDVNVYVALHLRQMRRINS